VGDVRGNADRVLEHSKQLYLGADEEHQPDLLVFPELILTGYPPEDLLLRSQFLQQIESALAKLAENLPCPVLLGAPAGRLGGLYNAAYLIQGGKAGVVCRKQNLPNYGVFDEKRYFVPGSTSSVIGFKGYQIGIAICEDLWSESVAASLQQAGAQCILSLNASPYHQGKQQERVNTIKQRSEESGLPIAYVNLHGAQDEVVFDGGSFVVSDTVVSQATRYQSVDLAFEFNGESFNAMSGLVEGELDKLEDLYSALVLATRDYVNKNNFKGVVLGLSGGIDSALTLAVAVDALGAERVQCIMMPSRYTSDMSLNDAQLIADNFKVQYHITSIESTFKASLQELSPLFGGAAVDTTEENMQARIRGMMVMAMSNKTGLMVLTTGNKSEYAVGYSTLYGDMVGGYAPLKDVSKTLVFELCRWRNAVANTWSGANGEIIPQRIIDRPPSAELAPDQKDEDSLPPYDILDQILERYVERLQSVEEIVAAGFDEGDVRDTVWRVNINEYKRRQSAPGVKVTPYAFGRERRYPITSGFGK
jgi:NAD+ synthase (glutamine-hydrolysing)